MIHILNLNDMRKYVNSVNFQNFFTISNLGKSSNHKFNLIENHLKKQLFLKLSKISPIYKLFKTTFANPNAKFCMHCSM